MAEKPRARILNVDDNDGGRYVITKILTRAGYDVIEAATGREGLRLAGERPDLILLDVNLPDISGFDVCTRIKADPRTASIPVVHLSATHVGSADRVVGLEGGADGYLVQPIDPQELVATVRAFLRLKDAEQALRESEEKYRLFLQNSFAPRLLKKVQVQGGAPGTHPQDGHPPDWVPGARRTSSVRRSAAQARRVPVWRMGPRRWAFFSSLLSEAARSSHMRWIPSGPRISLGRSWARHSSTPQRARPDTQRRQ